ncbi:DUF2724 domain-containing protein [Escherichia coli]
MKAFVTYLKNESPAMQLPSGSTGWIELPKPKCGNASMQLQQMRELSPIHPECHRSGD